MVLSLKIHFTFCIGVIFASETVANNNKKITKKKSELDKNQTFFSNKYDAVVSVQPTFQRKQEFVMF